MFNDIKDYLRSMKKTLFIMWVIFLAVSILGGMLVALYGADQVMELEKIVQDTIGQLGEEIFAEDVSLPVIPLFINNVRASFMATALGLIPFLRLPILSFIINVLLIPVVLGAINLGNPMGVVSAFVLGVLPHGIIELTAILISIIMGLRICRSISWAIRGKSGEMRPGEIIMLSVKTFVLVVIPALAVAAVIEIYVTTAILGITI